MERRVLIVGEAAGPEENVRAVLQRFGFSDPDKAATLGEALGMLRLDHYDLFIVPLQVMDVVQMAALDREMRKGQATFMIGTAPVADPDLILRAMRAGVHEFVLFPPNPEEFASAVDRLMRRMQSEVQRGKIFGVYSGKGGLGCTTIAVNLADGFARNHTTARVAIADLVVAGGDVRVLLNLKPAYHMGDLVPKLERLDTDLLRSLLTPTSRGVWALPGPDDPEYDNKLDGNVVGNILEHLRHDFAFTVLDCEHHLSERTLTALDAVDRILLITELTVPALRSTKRALALCGRLGYPDEKMCVVVNRYQSGEVLSLADAGEVLKHEIFWKIPNDYKGAASAMAKGVPVAEHETDSKLAASYKQLAAKLGGGSSGRNSLENGAGGTGAGRLSRLFGMKKRG
ncbi:MAG: hypothetical protein H7Z74_01820 [Anaerolineae bacterium]|nr:hypothetical protein [Gemmatimonadaceae bacterium]